MPPSTRVFSPRICATNQRGNAMKVIRAEDVPFEKHKARAREGGFEFRRILEGASGAPDNFVFRMTRVGADYTSPRHKHNFEQFRLVLEGTADFDRDGK